MTTQDESNDRRRPGPSSDAPAAKGSRLRLFLLLGLLALALFALWYDYKVARPAVERAFERVAAVNDEINNASEHRRMTNLDVQSTLGRSPSATFPSGKYTVEVYRWSRGMPIGISGLTGDESLGIGFKTHDYYAVYSKDGPNLAFVTHFTFDLDPQGELAVRPIAERTEPIPDAALTGMGGMGMAPPGGGGPGGAGPPGGGGPGGPGGGGGFDPEAFFAERDADGDGKLTGEEISERLRGRLDTVDTDGDGAVSKEEFLAARSQSDGGGAPGGEGPARGPSDGGGVRQQRPPLESNDDAPATKAAPSDAPAAAESKEVPADAAPEKPATEPAAEATPDASEETAKEESSSAS